MQDVSTSNQVKASIQRGIRGNNTGLLRVSKVGAQLPNSCLLVPAAKILEAYPILEETHAIDVILPKKESAVLAKWYASLESSLVHWTLHDKILIP